MFPEIVGTYILRLAHIEYHKYQDFSCFSYHKNSDEKVVKNLGLTLVFNIAMGIPRGKKKRNVL